MSPWRRTPTDHSSIVTDDNRTQKFRDRPVYLFSLGVGCGEDMCFQIFKKNVDMQNQEFFFKFKHEIFPFKTTGSDKFFFCIF